VESALEFWILSRPLARSPRRSLSRRQVCPL